MKQIYLKYTKVVRLQMSLMDLSFDPDSILLTEAVLTKHVISGLVRVRGLYRETVHACDYSDYSARTYPYDWPRKEVPAPWYLWWYGGRTRTVYDALHCDHRKHLIDVTVPVSHVAMGVLCGG